MQTTEIYDGQGNQVKRIDPDGSYTLYFFGMYEVHYNSGGTQTGDTLYYPAGPRRPLFPRCPMAAGSRLGQGAMRVNGTLYFILSDHLGSTSVVTDASGNEVGRMGYYPFGETRYTTGTLPTNKLFTGQQSLASLGIYNYKARDYDPSIGRFLSADTVTPGGPQGLNRYSYGMNNPILYNDPSGHWPDWGGVWGSVYSFAQEAGDYIGGWSYQLTDDMTFGLVSYVSDSLNACITCNRSDAYHAGQQAGRTTAIVASTAASLGGAALLGVSLASIGPTGGGSLLCGAVTAGACLLVGGVALSAEGAGVIAGTVISGYGTASALYIKTHPEEFDPQKQGRAGPNKVQNKQFNDAVKKINTELGFKLSKTQIQQLHYALHDLENPGYWDIVNAGLDMFGSTK